jgi:hypothetical protein
LHIHGAFPYILLRVGSAFSDALRAQLLDAINAVVADALRARVGETGGGKSGEYSDPTTSAILDIRPVQAKSVLHLI